LHRHQKSAPLSPSPTPIQLCRSLKIGDGSGWSLRPIAVVGVLVLVVAGMVVDAVLDSPPSKPLAEKNPPSHGSCADVDPVAIVGMGGNVGGGTTTTFMKWSIRNPSSKNYFLKQHTWFIFLQLLFFFFFMFDCVFPMILAPSSFLPRVTLALS
jgi:hypothetical protein